MKKLLTLLLGIALPVFAQTEDSTETTIAAPSFQHTIEIGIETNIVPFLYGGYHGSVWVSVDNWRFKGTSSKFTPPEFVINNAFTDLNIYNLSLMIDYFPIGRARWIDRLWFGLGGAYWHNEATNTSSEKGTFKNWMLSFGVGYIYYFYGKWYINPSLKGHLRVSGDKEVLIGGENYSTQLFTPEVSIIIGYHF